MAVSNIFGIYAVNLAGTTIPINQWNMSPNLAVRAIGSSGDVSPTHVHVMSASPSIVCQTTAIKALLDFLATPWRAKAIGATPVTFYLRKHVASGERSSGADFQSFAVASGIIVPRGLNASQGASAGMSFEVVPISTDGTDPVTPASGVANPGLATALAAQWTVGPVKINNTVTDSGNNTGVQSVNFDPGIGLEPISGDGDVYPSHINVSTARPTATINMSDAKTLADFGVAAVAQSVTLNEETTIYLRKLDQDGTRKGVAVTEHISFAMAAGIVAPGPGGGSHPSAVGSQLNLTPRYDGSNPMIAVNTAVAIPVT